MIRDYLPYKAAREYQDRGMGKWQGFFLSEHTSALKTSDQNQPQTIEEIYALLGQLYVQGQLGRFLVHRVGEDLVTFGRVVKLSREEVLLEGQSGRIGLPLNHIKEIQLVEEWDNE